MGRCEQYKASRPRKGHLVTCYDWDGHLVSWGAVTSVEGSICYYETKAGPTCFIWCFQEGLNKLHDWPTKQPTRRT
jgi:hypothetical protein